MNRKLFSLFGVLVAVVGFTVGGTDADARNCCGRQQNRCGQRMNNRCVSTTLRQFWRRI